MRRCPNAAAVTCARIFGWHAGAGSGSGTSSTTAEATLGGGVNASFGSVSTMRARVRHCVSTAKATVGLGAWGGDDALGDLLLEH